MYRQIVTASGQTFTLQLPGEMVGKTIEVIAFEVGEPTVKAVADLESERALRLQRIEELTKDKLVDLSKFKFDREAANDYSE